MYRFLLRPRWLLSHLLVLLLIVTLVNLGLWQLRRLDEKQDLNATIEARQDQPAAQLTDLIDVGDPFGAGGDVEYRAVAAEGVYQVEDEVLIHNRTLNGSPGRWVLTPLLLEDGSAVVVNRGWVPFTMMPGEPRPEAQPPSGTIVVEGVARATTTRSGIGTADPSGERLEAMSRADLERFGEQLDYEIFPVLVQLVTQTPPQPGPLPAPVEPPALSEGPHLGYAVQWFIFAVIAMVGYPLILRRVARTRANRSDGPEAAATVPT